jgi:hypothetical protein
MMTIMIKVRIKVVAKDFKRCFGRRVLTYGKLKKKDHSFPAEVKKIRRTNKKGIHVGAILFSMHYSNYAFLMGIGAQISFRADE